MYPAPRVTRHLPTRPSQHSPGPLPPGARQEACRGGRSRSLVVLSRNSRCPLPEPGPREGLWRARRPVAQGRRSVGGEGPRRPPCAGSSLERGPHPLRPSPGAVPAQAPVSPPRLSPRGPLSLPLLARSGAAAPAAGWKLPPRLCLDAFLRITGAPRGPWLGQPFLPENAPRPRGSPAVPLWEAPVGRALLRAVRLGRLAPGGRAGALGVVFSPFFLITGC